MSTARQSYHGKTLEQWAAQLRMHDTWDDYDENWDNPGGTRIPRDAEREEAAKVLQEIGPEGIPVLVDALQYQVCQDLAVQALQKSGTEAIPSLENAIRHENGSIRSGAIQALSGMGANAVPVLVQPLGELEISDLRSQAAKALRTIGEKAIPDLVEALSHSDMAIRLGAAGVLARISPQNDSAVTPIIPVLEAAIQDASESFRLEAIEIIAVMPSRKEALVPLLMQALRDKSRQVRAKGAQALGDLGSSASPAIADLLDLLRDPQAPVRRAAVHALGKLEMEATTVVPLLLEAATSDSDEPVRENAIYIACRLGEEAEVVPTVSQLLSDPNPEIRFAAADALWDQFEYQGALSVLIEVLGTDDECHRASAMLSLESVGVAIIPDLLAPYGNGNEQLKIGIEEVLERIGPDAIPVLERAIQDGKEDLRPQLNHVLAYLHDQQS